MKGVMLSEYANDTARLAHVAGLVNFHITAKKLDAFHPYLAAVIKRACALVPDEGPGILIFVSDLNLLLFSPTYGKGILDKLKAAAQGKKTAYLFVPGEYHGKSRKDRGTGNRH